MTGKVLIQILLNVPRQIYFEVYMLTNEKKNALYECYLSMRQSNSNAVLNCGNGKNVSVAEYNGIYIIRNGTKIQLHTNVVIHH